MVIALALRKYPLGLARPAVLHADFGVQLLDIFGGSVEAVAPHAASPEAVEEVLACGRTMHDEDGPLRDARDDDEIGRAHV
jgi:hypothetical protein